MIKIKCRYCNRPIHISKLAGVSGVGGKEKWVCTDCVGLMVLTPEDREKVVNESRKYVKNKFGEVIKKLSKE